LAGLATSSRQRFDNTTFRTVLITGEHEQLTVMRLRPGEEIGREVHDDHDQFLRIEQGRARVEFGRSADEVDETHEVEDDWAIIVPAGVWHNVINVGDADVKLYSLCPSRASAGCRPPHGGRGRRRGGSAPELGRSTASVSRPASG
jgi:mannose-6-phosphate isomerase-like protein (cupin superfamily)